MISITSFSLRHALFFLKEEKLESSLLERLLPAEYLCQQKINGSIKDYKIKSLSEKDPLFEEIHQVITIVRERISGPCSPISSQQLHRIIEFYQTYIQRVCHTTGKERSHLLKGKALLNSEDVSLLKNALKQDQDELVYSLITPSQQPFIFSALSSETDAEKVYGDWLIEAQKQKNVAMQVLILEKLSEFYLSEKRGKITIYPNDYATATEFLNVALALTQQEKIHPLYESHLLHKMEFLEKRAFRAFCQKEMPLEKQRDLLSRRKELQALRESIQKQADKETPIYILLDEITEKLRQFFATFIEESIHLLGPPKTAYAFIGLGSMARREMCPYSDLEFAILIEKNTEENKIYFRNLVRFLEIRIINMGETERPIGKNPKSPTPHGFSLDKGGNIPLGGVWELIGTPKQLAQRQNLQSLKENLVTSNALTYVCLITGSEGRGRSTLCERYQKAVSTELDAYVDGSRFSLDEKEKVNHIRAMILLKGHLREFELNLSEEKEKERVFGVKKEIYRIAQSLIDTLALFFHLEKQSTQLRIHEMIKKKILLPESGQYLLRALEAILMFRLRTQFFYKDGQRDYLYHPRISQPKSTEEVKNLLTLSDEYVTLLEEIYKTLYPFYYTVKSFFEVNAAQSLDTKEEIKTCKRINTLKDAYLYIDLITLARSFHQSLRTHVAERVIHQAVALNPNNTKALRLFVEIKIALGKQREGIQYIQEQLNLLKQTTQDETTWIEIASSLNLLGRNLQLIHAFKGAQQSHQEALNVLEKIDKKNIEGSIVIIDTLKELGECSQALGILDEAEKYYQDALNLAEINSFFIYHDDKNVILYKKRGAIGHCLGTLYYLKRDLNKADNYFKKSFEDYSTALNFAKSSANLNYSSYVTQNIVLDLDPTYRQTSLRYSNLHSLSLGNHQFLQKWFDPALDIDRPQKTFVDNQIREIFLYQTLTCLSMAKVMCDSENKIERECGIVQLEEILEKYKNPNLFIEQPDEAIIKCLLVIATAHFKSEEYVKAMKYAEMAFIQAEKKKMFSLIQSCFPVFVMFSLERPIPQPKEAITWGQKILIVLEEMKEEQGCYLLLPTFLQLNAIYQKFFPKESTDYLNRALSLITKYGKENFMNISIEEVCLQWSK